MLCEDVPLLSYQSSLSLFSSIRGQLADLDVTERAKASGSEWVTVSGTVGRFGGAGVGNLANSGRYGDISIEHGDTHIFHIHT